MIPNARLKVKNIWPNAFAQTLGSASFAKFGSNKKFNPFAAPSNVIPLIPRIKRSTTGSGTVHATVFPTEVVPFLSIKYIHSQVRARPITIGHLIEPSSPGPLETCKNFPKKKPFGSSFQATPKE